MASSIYTPVAGSLGLSALVAAIPIFALLLALGVFRLPAWKSALLGLGVAILLAIFVYGMPAHLMGSATLYGAAFGLFPIGWIVYWAIVLYLTVETGQFEIIKSSVGHLTGDQRLQALLIAFAFGAFLEGATGFGTPVAIAASMLAGLGFPPFRAAAICLLANTAPVAFGAIGIPLVTLAGITGLPLGRPQRECRTRVRSGFVVHSGVPRAGAWGLARAGRSDTGGNHLRRRVRRHAISGFEFRRPILDGHTVVVDRDGGVGYAVPRLETDIGALPGLFATESTR